MPEPGSVEERVPGAIPTVEQLFWVVSHIFQKYFDVKKIIRKCVSNVMMSPRGGNGAHGAERVALPAPDEKGGSTEEQREGHRGDVPREGLSRVSIRNSLASFSEHDKKRG